MDNLFTKDTIKKSIIRINKSRIQIIFVTNKKKQLVGTVTYGDIIKSILQKKNLNTPLSKIMNPKYYFVDEETDHSLISFQMRKRELHYIPVINSQKIIKKIYSDRENILKKESIKGKAPNNIKNKIR